MTGAFKVILLLIFLTGAASALPAQVASGYRVTDSTSVASGFKARPLPSVSFRPAQLIAPGVLFTSGVLIHCFAHDTIDKYVQERVLAWRDTSNQKTIDDYVQYLPFACAAGLGLAGVDVQHHPFGERLIVLGYSAAAYFVLTHLMKSTINSPRPDGTANNSFPSGHTGTAFAGAEFVRIEYGWGWGAGAYALATGIAFMRLHNNRHWFSDTLAGAGVGILCAHIGEWLVEPTMKLFKCDVAVVPSVDPFTGSYGAALAFNF